MTFKELKEKNIIFMYDSDKNLISELEVKSNNSKQIIVYNPKNMSDLILTISNQNNKRIAIESKATNKTYFLQTYKNA